MFAMAGLEGRAVRLAGYLAEIPDITQSTVEVLTASRSAEHGCRSMERGSAVQG